DPKKQAAWNGTSGLPLLRQSAAFIQTLVSGTDRLASRPIGTSRVLDYGCGWGRLLALLLKYVPEDNLYGVDPDTGILVLAKQLGVRGKLGLIPGSAGSLPFEVKFELVFAFSVFTHLGEKAGQRAISLINKHLTDDGLLVVTVRPREIWDILDHQHRFEMKRQHDLNGFAFAPHNWPAVDGEVPYCDTS